VTVWHRGLLLPGLFAILGLAILIALGTWQLERRAWKEALIATLRQRLAAPPVALPPPSSWTGLDPDTAEFRRVSFSAEFLPGTRSDERDREARLYTGGSALRDDVKLPGYFAFAPARLPAGAVVVINRGYVANPRPTAATIPSRLPEDAVKLTGVMRWPERPGWFDTTYSAADDLWFVRDHRAMAARLGWGQVAPFYIELEAPAAGSPRPGVLRVNLPNDHLQYALTWYGLALVLVVVFAAWVRGRLGRPAP
jgi:cytochrome oxidase assembly protein ShyY1